MEEANACITNDEFLDISSSNLLDSIDFDDMFLDIDNGDELPDLEMDPDLLAEFSISGGDESSTMSVENVVSPNSFFDGNLCYVFDGVENGYNNINNVISEDLNVQINDDDDDNNNGGLIRKNQLDEVETQSKRKSLELESVTPINSTSFDKVHKMHKISSHGHTKTRCNNKSSNNHGKRKTKVDWTQELHKRFVQAVEQLGVHKAVPSRILELMGIHSLTRHNIASHLQKYRSHRKHSLAREVEAVNWTQKRQMYGVSMSGSKHGASTMSWPQPLGIGFSPVMTTMHHPLRPLHVWGHPTMDTQASMTMWPKQLVLPMSPPPSTWTPHHPPIDAAFWHPSHHHRLPLPPVLPGIPPHALYRPEHRVLPPRAMPFGRDTSTDVIQTKENVDASLGDVLAKPWLPLPIGLKPPSIDTVLVELQSRGFPKIPPSCG